MEQLMTNFFKFRFVPTYIVEARSVKKRYIALQMILVGCIIAFPLAIGMYGLNLNEIIKDLFPYSVEIDDLQSELLNSNDIFISNGNEIIIRVDDNAAIDFDRLQKYIVLRESYVQVVINGASFYGGYTEDLESIMSQQNIDTITLLSSLLRGISYNIFSLLAILIYPVAIILNIIFIFFICIMALLLNINAYIKLTFREFMALCSYSATIPALAALVLGTFVSIAFVYLIYNFGLLLFAYYIYKKSQEAI